MPKVTFVNEHRVVEVEKGRLVSDVARELGIAFRREAFAGTEIGDSTVWIRGEPDCVSPPGFIERLKGARGRRRFADRTRILGDCEITTQGGLGDRLGGAREIAAPPSPMADPSLIRPPDAAATAAFPYGHPSAVGKGERAAIPRGRSAEAAKAKAEAEKAGSAVAKPAATAPASSAAAVAKPAATVSAPVASEKAEAAPPPASASASAPAAAAKPGDADAEKAARIAEKKARQAAMKARLAAGDGEPKPAIGAELDAEAKPEAAALPGAEASPAPAPEPSPAEPKADAKPPMDPDKAARIAEKKARQAALKARLAAPDPKPGGSEGE